MCAHSPRSALISLRAVVASNVVVAFSRLRPLGPVHARYPRDRLLERRQLRAGDVARQLRSLVQRRARVRLRPLDQLQDLLIAQDSEGRQVRASGVLVAPAPDLAQIGQLAAGQPPGSLDAPGVVGIA